MHKQSAGSRAARDRARVRNAATGAVTACLILVAGCGDTATSTGCADWLADGAKPIGIDTSGAVENAYFDKFDQTRISVEFLAEQNTAVFKGCEADPESAVGDHLIPPGGS